MEVIQKEDKTVPPRPLKVFIDPDSTPLGLKKTKYVLKLLLKTAGFPYHFTKHCKNADIVYRGNDSTGECNARLVIKSDENLKKFCDKKHSGRILEEGGIPFIVFDKLGHTDNPTLSGAEDNRVIENDIIFSVFYLVEGIQEKWTDKDKHGIHNVTQSFLYKDDYLYKSIVNIYSNLLREFFYESHQPLDIWPDNKTYAVALTHDCDYPEIKRGVEAVRYIIKKKASAKIHKIFDILFSKNQTFWNFSEWIELEQKYGLKSAFYFCAFKGSMWTYYLTNPNPFYDITTTKYRNLFRDLKGKGFEIGLHSSYHAYASEEAFRDEREKLMECSEAEVLGNRHHYWHTSPKNFCDTVGIHRNVGFLYDTSLCFEKHCGFRRSICTPFFFLMKRLKRNCLCWRYPLL